MTTEDQSQLPDRLGLYLCCMRAADRHRGISVGGIFQCDKCQQHVIEYGKGAFRVATPAEVEHRRAGND